MKSDKDVLMGDVMSKNQMSPGLADPRDFEVIEADTPFHKQCGSSDAEYRKLLRQGEEAANASTFSEQCEVHPDATLKWSQIPLAGAVFFWALSFYCGCRYLNHVSSTLYSNMALLRVGAGLDASVGTHPGMIAAAQEGIRTAIEEKSNKTTRLGRLQFRFLILGAAFFLAWHVTEMWLRTIQSTR